MNRHIAGTERKTKNLSHLVIVESPAKAKTIEKYLGKDYSVVASVGHIRDLPKSKLGVDVDNNFEPKYENKKDKAALIKELKKDAKAADIVYLATDPDREGEAISWHLAHVLGISPGRTCACNVQRNHKERYCGGHEPSENA